jgi:hypothetical protein
MNTYEFPIVIHQVKEQYRVMVYLDQCFDHDLKQAMLLVSKFQNQYHQNNVMVKMNQMALHPKYILS